MGLKQGDKNYEEFTKMMIKRKQCEDIKRLEEDLDEDDDIVVEYV